MAIFDPLGLVTPFTVKGRLLVQDVWRAKIDWDECVPVEVSNKWISWIDELKMLRSLRVPRCYAPNISKASKIELHTFVDGSKEAFAAAAYLRIETLTLVHTVLVIARAKVAPLKTITIPRMELQAALVGSRLAKTIEEDLELNLSSKTFWSDSQTVLYWINSDSNNFKPYVAHRIGEIQGLTNKEEWRWVPTKDNVADLATRGKPKFSKDLSDIWMYGPKFLKLDVSEWPEHPAIKPVGDDVERKNKFVGLHQAGNVEVLQLGNYNSWDELVGVCSRVIQYIDILKFRISSPENRIKPLKKDTKVPSLNPDDRKKAESCIFRLLQETLFHEDLFLLRRNKNVTPSSRLFQLNPFLDSEGVMRCKGRISSSPDLSYDEKHPIILDGKDCTVRLLIRKYHQKCFHQGLETVMVELRRRFWILKLRTAVKKVKTDCAWCQLKFKMSKQPEMAPLHLTRVKKPPHAFYYTGVDYFRPVEVTVGRRHEKRWGVLFTCLSTRAVHLEVAHSLDTESCIMAIQRFVSRRPCPYEMLSDNGTNFTAAEKELRSSVRCLDHVQIQEKLNNLNGIKWTFTAPCAPHMGGSWERLVRSVKTALKAVLTGQAPKDEEFRTLLVRIEDVLNCRPLTHIPVDPDDDLPLTPNHFLKEAFCRTIVDDQLRGARCRKIKNLLDNFWKRWIKGYIPGLIKHQKWHLKQIPPKLDDLVIIADESNPRNTWPIGKIVALHPGNDGQIRVVDIKTTKGATFRRAMNKVVILRGENDVDN